MDRDTARVSDAIRSGADLNRRTWIFGADNFSGWTALMWAAYQRDDRIIKMLVDAGADGNLADRTGRTALHIIFYGENTSAAAPCVLALLRGGADPNYKNSSAETPLHNAVRSDDIDSIKALIGGGADVNASDTNGPTVLQIAALDQRNLQIVQLLLEQGADVRRPLPNGRRWIEVVQDSDVDPEIAKAIFDAAIRKP